MDTKALRQKILDLAIRGKLVPQDPNDEPASVLLERIREEKLQMVADGRLKKKDIKNDTIIYRGDDNLHYEKFQDGTAKCIEEEIPFEVPEGWEWCRFLSVTLNRDGERKPVSASSRKNLDKIYDYYGASGIIDKVDTFLFNERLLLIGEDGANLVTRSKPIAFLADGKYWVNNHAHCINATDKYILEYLCFFVNAINLEKYVTGSAQPKMNQAKMNSILVPLPPIKEQRRINNLISKLNSQISVVEDDKCQIDELINRTKSKILDLAIQGKLVPQIPDDEPASILLERIREEKEEHITAGKLKRDKKESIIYRGDDNSYYEKYDDGNAICVDESIQFEIPQSWQWVKLGELIDLYSGQDLIPDRYNDQKKGIPYITGASNLDDGRIIINRWTDSPTMHSQKGDLLLTCKGSGVGKMAFNTIGDCHIARQIMALRCKNIISSGFLKIILDAFINSITSQANGIIPGIRREIVLSLLVPLPPKNEQDCMSSKTKSVLDLLLYINNAI